jgi:WD40 repeat protein
MRSPSLNSPQFDLYSSKTLSDYVTALAWSPRGDTLAVSDAAGEVKLWYCEGNLVTLLSCIGKSVDCLAFSPDGQFLAAGGQDGKVKIWRSLDNELVATLENAPAWIDRLAWSPTSNQLAFSMGRYVQVWDVDLGEITVTLNFDNSSILGLDWRCDGQYVAIAGYQGVKVWQSQDWDEEPYILDIPSASVAIAWSPEGKYLAAGNMDRTIAVMKWDNPNPWVMRGFPGKIRTLAWSEVRTGQDAPLLASSSVEGIVVWEKQAIEFLSWQSRVLARHTEVVQAIAFQPHSLLLASASADGCVCLWHRAKRLAQVLNGAPDGFSCLAWHPQGQQLAAGGHNGELLIWSKAMRGQGFGRR